MEDPMRSLAARFLALATLFGLALQSAASAEQIVKFASAVPRGQPAAASNGEHDIQGYLTKPRGDGPLAAVVLLHSCLGLPADRRSMGETLARWGYVALFVDDFTTRGLEQSCAVDFPQGVPDAFGALAFLSTLPYVDPKRIAAIGWSQGADTALEIASSRLASSFAVSDVLNFRAAAAFYPPCDNRADATLRIPTLILIGGSDAVTPAADCERLAKRQPGDSSVKLVVYRGADHEFDDPEFVGGKSLFGMWLKYDADAAKRCKAELRDFLAAKLARQ
jgi:dienelactone hydrolase